MTTAIETPAVNTTAAKPLTIMRIAWGIFFGNLFTAILAGIIYALFFMRV